MKSENNATKNENMKSMTVFSKFKECCLFYSFTDKMSLKDKIFYCVFNVLLIFAAILVLGFSCMLLAYGTSYSHEIFRGYLNNSYILLLNLLPPFVLFVFFYAILQRAWLAYFFDGFVFLALSLSNFYLLRFRNDPLMFSDLLYLKEAVGISSTQSYDYSLTKRIVVCLAAFLLFTVLLYFFARYKPRIYTRIFFAVLSVVLCFSFKGVYFDDHIYDIKTQNNDSINRWSQTQVYISKGFVYPFIHSIKDVFVVEPAGYNEDEAKNILSLYENYNIPDENKVNIISIMLEAFCDIEKIGVTGIDESVYAEYRKIRDENFHGTLVTNIFAGGTIDSERAFLTGYQKLQDYRKPIDSYVRYLNSQGYYTEGSHPSQDWFYNRKNVNKYIGFNAYRFSENYFYEKYGENMRRDSVVFPEYFSAFEDAKSNGNIPYFGFHVTYQGHGPYSATSHEWGNGTYYNNPDASPEANYIVDNYLGSVKETSGHLAKLVEKIKVEEEPLVLLIFGDHKPWLGDSNSVYNELGINIDLSTEEGFMNYYSTEYVIVANDAAKELLDDDFCGEGPMTSTCFLMNVLFDKLSFAGNDYMGYTDNIREKLPALNSVGAFDKDGQFYTLGNLTPFLADVYNSYERIAFYRSKRDVVNP